MRDLCTIQTIKGLQPIPEKDRIVYASFENTDFHVIVDKSYMVGEKVVFCEADTILPPKPQFEFLRSRCWSSSWNGFRITNMKMAGLYSEGIVFHITEAIPFVSAHPSYNYTDGDDVTDTIGAVKYDPESLEENTQVQQKKYGPIMRRLLRIKWIKNLIYPKKKSNSWPIWISKTDETRAQSLSYIYDSLRGKEVYVSEKIDGQSGTFAYHKKRFYVCSRNMVQPKSNNNFWLTERKYRIEEKLKKASKAMKIDLYIQGEQMGPGIQGNKYGFTDLYFCVFNVYDITRKKYLGYWEFERFCEVFGFDTVPILDIKVFDWENIEQLLEYSKGTSILKSPVHPLREGVVIRTIDAEPPQHKMSNMNSFKVINPDFDLKYNKSSKK